MVHLRLCGVALVADALVAPRITRHHCWHAATSETETPGWKRATPNALTALRLGCVPIVFGALRCDAPRLACGCFAGASITDAFDGYLARRWRVESRLGAFLDPVADKLIVVTTMVLLAAAPPGPLEGVGVPAWALPAAALVIACRELLVSAVRVEGGWSGSGCSIVAGAGGLVGAPRQGSPNGSLHTSGQCSPTVTRRDVRNELGEWVTDEKSSLPAERKAVAFASSSEPCDAGAMALVRRNSALKEQELRGTRDLLNSETAFRPRPCCY